MYRRTVFTVVLFVLLAGGLLWTGLPQAAVIVVVRSIRGEPVFDEAPRPQNIQPDAVRIGHHKMRFWARCRVEAKQNHCQVFNAAGDLLMDEVFLPLDGGLPVAAEELQIDPLSDLDTLRLRNGRELGAARTYDRQKETFDKFKTRTR